MRLPSLCFSCSSIWILVNELKTIFLSHSIFLYKQPASVPCRLETIIISSKYNYSNNRCVKNVAPMNWHKQENRKSLPIIFSSVADPDLFGRIRTSGTGSGSWRLGPDPDPGFNKWPYLNLLGVFKSNTGNNLSLSGFNFLVDEYTFQSIFPQKKCSEETWPKIYLGQDPDPIVFKSRIRIRSKIVRLCNTDYFHYLEDF
jgi:hypothetical protein